MAILFAESFDVTVVKTELQQGRWDVNGVITISTLYGRNGNGCLLSSGSNTRLRKLLPSTYATGGCAIALRLTAYPDNETRIIKFYESTVTDHIELRILTDGRLRFVRGDGTTLGTSTNSLSLNTWYHVEVKVTINDTTGAAEVKVNNTSANWIALSSIDTRNGGGGNYFNAVQVGYDQPNFSAAGPQVDDIVIWDTSGSINTSFIGDCAVLARRPDGAGATTDFTPTLAPNWKCVDEDTPNEDVDYIFTSAIPKKDTWTTENLGLTGTIKAVQLSYRVRKTDAGTISVRSVIRHSTSEAFGVTQAPNTSYQYFQDIFETNPSTSAQWTDAQVDAMQIGVQSQ